MASRPQDVISLVVPARFAAVKHCHPATLDDLTSVLDRERHRHLLLVDLGEPVEGLEQTRDVFRSDFIFAARCDRLFAA